ncbi:helix-hairpin-helix domain-containing protein [Sulfurospirillum sp. 1612]|uniref:helix-hairpin-helix domain-containing protein n=1 Tax=Sulfurospirillum sp. 1612 TaxID=3094835 RepID=UPI002F954300
MSRLIAHLVQKTTLSKQQIENILKLLQDGATIPFIARYRKEMSGGASDEVLREFETLYLSSKRLLEKKEEITRLIQERATLSDAIRKRIEAADNLRVLEDIYRPFKENKTSRGGMAIASGLEPLAQQLQSGRHSIAALRQLAQNFLNETITSIDAAIKGAQDILAQRYAEDSNNREALRASMLRSGIMEIKKTKNFQEKGLFKNFIDKKEKISYIPSHRYLAIMRGVHEKELSVKISIALERVEADIKRHTIPHNAADSKALLFDAYLDGFKRLLFPSIEREVHAILKERADEAAVTVFGKNLAQLLLTPPVTKRVILGVDPAFVSGCKLAVIDENGNYLEHVVIYPTAPKNDYENSKKTVAKLTEKYHIRAVAIGNGTASRETQEFFAKLNRDGIKLDYTVVSEAGASIYSASKLAQDEYPMLDVTIRGAISIAQRLRDPMATFVKIDPKSLGIGQYQHDVNQKLLEKKLRDITTDLVNRVGVDINSASLSLLSYVAGIGPSIAANIIKYRNENGNFRTKSDLLKVKGLGQKAYEQAAGFIRIKEGENPFDNSGIHPESYTIAQKLEPMDLDSINLNACASTLGVGVLTLKDIIFELKKPGFDPRSTLPAIPFKNDVTDITMIKEGSVVSGIVRNITDFGAFVDIGLKHDGMIHISKMREKRISHPLEVLALNQYLPQITVVSVDYETGKVGLSLIES